MHSALAPSGKPAAAPWMIGTLFGFVEALGMDTFRNDEDGYLAWHQNHEQGFVMNRFGGTNPVFNVLHRSNCTFLWRNVDEGTRTAVEKWCSESEQELAQQADCSRKENVEEMRRLLSRVPASPPAGCRAGQSTSRTRR